MVQPCPIWIAGSPRVSLCQSGTYYVGRRTVDMALYGG
ncbi:hypothetical protein ICL55_29595 [Chitinophaga varians]|nr:hypothetical protein [Chitinophaga varians]